MVEEIVEHAANGQQQQEAHQVVGLGASNAGEGKARAVPDDGDRNSATVGGRTERANAGAEGARGAQEEQRAADSGSRAGAADRANELAEQLVQCLRQIAEVEQQDIFVVERMHEMSPGSAAETEQINHHLRLIEEKEQLSRRQDFLNAQLDLNETEQRIAQLRAKIAAEDTVDGVVDHNGTVSSLSGSPSPFYAALRHQNNTALLMELKQQIDHKNDLVMRISDYEDEA